MTKARNIGLVLLCWFACELGINAVTQIDLTFQVKNSLPIANGGTNATTAATAFANLAQTPTSPLTLSGSTYACPTCSTGPNLTTIGGMLGAQVQAVGNAITYCWFCSTTSQTSATLSTDIWISGLTANITGTMSAGSFYSIGLANFASTTAYPYGPQFTIQGGATAGAYQSSAGPVFVNGSAKNAINVTSISPSGAAAATLNYVTANVVGQNIQPQRWGANITSVAGSTTVYVNPGQSVTPNATENLMVVPFPYAGTVSSLCFVTTGAQAAVGTLTATFRYGATFGAIADTSLVSTVPISAGAGTYCDFSHTVSVAAGGVSTIKIVNSALLTGATVNGISYNIVPSGAGPTGMIIFGSGAQTIASGSPVYFSAFRLTGATGTESSTTAAMSRAATAKNLYCYVTTAPGTNSDVVTVRQNSASPASGLAVTITTSTTGIISDTSHTISFANLDLLDLQHSQSSGSNPAVSSCSMEID